MNAEKEVNLRFYPKKGEKYFYPCASIAHGVDSGIWEYLPEERLIEKRLGVYETFDEAYQKVKELKWV